MTTTTYTAKCHYCDDVLTATEGVSTDAELEAVERESCDECARYYAEPSVGMHDTWAEWNGER